MTKEIVACCTCKNVPDYTRKSFPIIFPDKKLPSMYVGGDEIRKLAESLSPSTNIYKYLLALARNKEKYSYYFEYDENGDIVAQYNLLNGRKVS